MNIKTPPPSPTQRFRLGALGEVNAFGFIRIPIQATFITRPADQAILIPPGMSLSLGTVAGALIRALGGANNRWTSDPVRYSAFGVSVSIAGFLEVAP